ncbi:MAG: metallophosphoesterase, partial [Anaerolineae bacterium]|nr:metallophosphoesterase [Anaerolineae bacterium]
MSDRFLNLSDGSAMIVTDLHGDHDAFSRYVNRFRTLHKNGEAQRLIFLGDLIHGYGPPETDGSLPMLLQVMALQTEFGPDNVIMLLGNHEMPHIYGVSLMKGEIEFTPRFEHALGDHRERVLDFFTNLPFYARTAAGVMLAHAGPAAEVIARAAELHHFDHTAILRETDNILAQADDLTPLYQQYGQLYGTPYAQDAEYLLAIQGPDDPRYSHLLRAFMIGQQSQEFRLLWDALFTMNEVGIAEMAYLQTSQQFLEAFSVDAPAPQRVMVSGHIITPAGGHTLVNRFHLRLSSAAHAHPREA